MYRKERVISVPAKRRRRKKRVLPATMKSNGMNSVFLRLDAFEKKQEKSIQDMQEVHEKKMNILRRRLKAAQDIIQNAKLNSASSSPTAAVGVDMTVIDSAVQAAHLAAQRSESELRSLKDL